MKSAAGMEDQQYFVAVQFGDGNTEPVMMPVDSLAVLDDEAAKELIIDSAWQHYLRGQYARDKINPQIIAELAKDFSQAPDLEKFIVGLVIAGVAKACVERLEAEVRERGEAVVDRNALHLTSHRDEAEQITITVALPADWETKAKQRMGRLRAGILDRGSTGLISWHGFTEWLWVNHFAGALGDLEAEIGEEALENLKEKEFDKVVFDRMVNHNDSCLRLGEFTFRYAEMVAEIATDAICKATDELWKLERLLGFRDNAPPETTECKRPLILTVDFAALLQLASEEPARLHQLAPRRFEELIAHIFERFGYEVEVTPKTRDGGYDVAAVRKAEAEIRLLIECKRYTPPHKVGRPTVQQLYGVLADRRTQATKGIIATTSTFTNDAKSFILSNRWIIEGRDAAGIADWIGSLHSKDN
jgi:hypothetical protein